MCGDLDQAIEILALETKNADRFEIAQFLLAPDQRRARNFDRVVERALTPGQSFQQPSRFSATAAAKFCDDYGTRNAIDDVLSVAAQQAIVRASEPVFRQMADDFEKRRTDVVV